MSAPVHATPPPQITFDWATVGNAGNAADPATGFGAVAYEYRISKTEVTNAQYTEFLNAVAATDTHDLYNTDMAGNLGGISRSGFSGSYIYSAQAGRANNPVTYVSWIDSARFVNWLHNGQTPASDTETGVYTINNGLTETRNVGAQYFLPSEDEWYKAAYHNAAAGTAGDYFTYATGSDSVPVSDHPDDNPSAVNYRNDDGIANGFNGGYAVSGTPFPGGNPSTEVGAYTDADSPYGTFDQTGNAWEWNETLGSGSSRVRRGGSWASFESNQRSSSRPLLNPTTETIIIGFRIASPVPTPGDVNLDGVVDTLDIQPFVDLVSGGGFQDEADVNGDGVVDTLDIQPFVDIVNGAIGGSDAAAVPEPGSLALLGLSTAMLMRRRPRKRPRK